MIGHQVLFIFNDEDEDKVKKVTEELKRNMSLEYTISTWKELKEQAKPLMALIEKNDYNLIVFFIGNKELDPATSSIWRRISIKVPFIVAIIGDNAERMVPISLQKTDYVNLRHGPQAIEQLIKEIYVRLR